jgi:hypothetical protein
VGLPNVSNNLFTPGIKERSPAEAHRRVGLNSWAAGMPKTRGNHRARVWSAIVEAVHLLFVSAYGPARAIVQPVST